SSDGSIETKRRRLFCRDREHREEAGATELNAENADDQVLLPLPRRRKRRARLSRSMDGKAPHPAGPAVDRRVDLPSTGQTEAVMSMPAEQEVMEIQGHPTCGPGQRFLVEVPERFAVARWPRDADVSTICRYILGTLIERARKEGAA